MPVAAGPVYTGPGLSKHPHREKAKAAPPQRAPDGAIYTGLVMIGIFAIALWALFAQGIGTWKQGLIGYVIAMALLINIFTFQACRGRHLAGWQQSLARLPLRWVGFGTRQGKPLEAAHGSPRAKAMLAVSIAASVLLVALLSFWLIRP